MAEEILNLPEAEYHALGDLSCSRLKPMAKSPAHFQYALQTPIKPTPAMNLGSLVHAMILEDKEAIETDGFAIKMDGRTKAGKAHNTEALEAGKTLVSEDDVELAKAIRKAVFNNQKAAQLLNNAAAKESTILFEYEDIRLKAKLDGYSDIGVVFDIKTTGKTIDEFPRQAYNLKYHLQAAIYSEAYRQIHGEPKAFVFIVVETAPPHGVACFIADDDFIAEGKAEFDRLIKLYKDCQNKGEWPGYPDELRILELPAWVHTEAGL